MRKINATAADIAEFANMARKVSVFSQMTVSLLEKIFAFVMLFEFTAYMKSLSAGRKFELNQQK